MVAEVRGFEGQRLAGSGSTLDAASHTYETRWIPRRREHEPRDSGSVLGSMGAVRASLAQNEQRLLADPACDRLAAFTVAADDVALAMTARAAGTLGLSLEVGARWPLVPTMLGPGTQHRRLWERMSRALVDADLLALRGDGFLVRAQLPHLDIPAELSALERDHPFCEVEIALLRRLPGALAGVVSGRLGSADALLGEGTADLMRRFFATAPSFAPLNELLHTAVRELSIGLPPGQSLRVLEIGAGTGGATGAVLAALPSEATEYVFTDVTASFFAGAQDQFGSRIGFSCAVLDIERDPASQGLATGSFDLVVASDVLHATRDIEQTLAFASQLLGTGGVLLLIEVTNPPLFIDLTFGLAEGWWRFDDAVRSTSCFLPEAGWRAVLAKAGFEDLASATSAHKAFQCMFAARRGRATERQRAAGTVEKPTVWLLGPDGPLRGALTGRFALHGVLPRVAERLPDDWCPDGSAPPVIVVLDPLSAPQEVDEGTLLELHRRTSRVMGDTVVRAASATGAIPTRIVAVTRAANRVLADDAVDISQAPTWGVGRVLANEYPLLPVSLVDLGVAPDFFELDALVRECLASDCESDVSLRGAARYVLRILRVSPDGAPNRLAGLDEAVTLHPAQIGVLPSLEFIPTERPAELGPDEVEVRVHAVGLNFRDVMQALGLLPRELQGEHYGLECAGVVVRAGANAQIWQPGDEVFGMAEASFGSFARAHHATLARKPAHLTHAEAATIPAAMGTAWYCLEVLTQIRPDEHVLIHGGAGGVGHAAIQLARRRGAIIHATAGSPAKRRHLSGLGVQHTYDSRSFAWVDEVLANTGGGGVDILLNSLSGKAIPRGLEVLARYGRFLEIGISDIFQHRRISLWSFRKNLTYFAVELHDLCRDRPVEFGSRVLAPLARLLETGEIEPLPHTPWPAAEVAEAFAQMSRSAHIGKVVVELKPGGIPVAIPARRLPIDPGGVYVLTGGTRGVTFGLAEWLVERGATRLALWGRTGTLEARAERRVAEWRARGLTVEVRSIDVADASAVAAELTRLRREQGPIRGVVHGAMVLADGAYARLNDERFSRALGPKAGGALVLDRLTAGDDLDFFVLLSSISSPMGSAAQANYNAANAVLEALAWRRRGQGKPSTVLSLGAVADVGFVSRSAGMSAFLKKSGVEPTPPELVFQALENAVADGAVHRIVGVFAWRRIVQEYPASRQRSEHVSRGQETVRSDGTLAAALEGQSPAQRLATITAAIIKVVARITAATEASTRAEQRLTDLGLDSLMVTQLSGWILSNAGVSIPSMRLLKGPTIDELAREVAGMLEAHPPQGTGSP